ncbi:protein Iojap-related, mitochondrial isoform X2 [Malania oleifera]|nr:protein Iojap-related, mitochondrial isoform X2 [Malania oleifera]
MWAAVRARSLPSLSSPSNILVPPPWKLGFLGFLERTLYSTALDNSGGGGGSCSSQSKFLDLQEVKKVLTDVKADNVEVIPVRGRCDWTDYMVFATGRSPWHVRNIAEALIYQTKKKLRVAEQLSLPIDEEQKAGQSIGIGSGVQAHVSTVDQPRFEVAQKVEAPVAVATEASRDNGMSVALASGKAAHKKMQKKLKKLKQVAAGRLLLPSVEGLEGGKWVVIDSGSIIVHALDENARAYYRLERLWTTKMSHNELPTE